jgi:hypothetical protein
MASDDVVKTCNCGETYTAETWPLLPMPQGGGRWADGDEVLELRNCICGSTIAVTVDDRAPWDDELTVRYEDRPHERPTLPLLAAGMAIVDLADEELDAIDQEDGR